MSPRILKPSRARLAQPLGQRGPRPGPRWPAICQVLDFTVNIDPPVADAKNLCFASLFKSLRPACSLLRQVCALCELAGEHPTETSSETLVARSTSASPRQAKVASERRSHPVVRRLADCSMRFVGALALVVCMVATPSRAADLWSHGSSFSASEGGANWVRTGFVEPERSREGEREKATPRSEQPFVPDPDATPITNLRNLIAHAEAGAGGYDAVQVGASVRPEALPTAMTLDEIRAWVAASPGQPHAIGRYQFIPSTFERLAAATATSGNDIFDPELQDRWANALILEAGYADFVSGRLTPDAFMDNLAAVWAGLPLASGLSAYDGIAGNHATISRAAYSRALTAIFPAQSALASASR